MELNPKEDVKIDKFALHIECERMADIMYSYGELWEEAFSKLKSLSAKFDDLQDDLKGLKARLAFEAKVNWKKYSEFDKSPSDKVAENWVYTQQEYKDLIDQIKQVRKELSEVESKEHKYKNFHFILVTKSSKIDQLKDLFNRNYYTGSIKNITEEGEIDDHEILKQKMQGRRNE